MADPIPFNFLHVRAFEEQGGVEPDWYGPWNAESTIYQVERYDDYVYVQRTANWQIMKIEDGSIWAYFGLSSGFETISDFTIDRIRSKLVVVTAQNRLRVADMNGVVEASTPVASFPNQFTGQVAVDRNTSDIYTGYYDGSNYKVRRYKPDLSGGVQDEWNAPAPVRGLAAGGGRVYVTTVALGVNGDGRIDIYEANGDHVDTWGYDGATDADRLWTPSRIVYGGTHGIFVSTGYGAIRRFTLAGAFVSQISEAHDGQGISPKGLSQYGSRIWYSSHYETPTEGYDAVYGYRI